MSGSPLSRCQVASFPFEKGGDCDSESQYIANDRGSLATMARPHTTVKRRWLYQFPIASAWIGS